MKKTTLLLLLSTVTFLVNAQTQIIAHRGLWKNSHVSQNSIASLDHAIQQKTWGSEFDVHLTKDNVLVVNHDADFYGLEIAKATYQQLLTQKHPNGESIPTAEEYLKYGMQQTNTKLIYELKTSSLGLDRTLEAVALTIALVKKLKAETQVEYIAFSYEACLKLRDLDKNAIIHYLNGDKSPKQIKKAKLSGIDYHINIYKKHPNWIRKAQQLKLLTNVWTVDKPEDMTYFIKKKIDYITTNEPEQLQKLLLF